MRDLLWQLLAWFLVDRPRLVDWLVRRAQRTPYTTLWNRDSSLYMERWWLVGPKSWLRFVLPQMRFHLIHSPDLDRDPHDHPWAFRSIILAGGYREMRYGVLTDRHSLESDPVPYARVRVKHLVFGPGQVNAIGLGEFHQIVELIAVGNRPRGPVLTLCVLGEKQDSWGFLTEDGVKVPWRDYLGLPSDVPEGFQP